MNNNRPSLSDCRLYGILDLGYVAPEHAAAVASQMIRGGIEILQLRAKEFSPADLLPLACELRKQTDGVPFIINDFAELAVQCGADGVHVGQDDMSVAAARAIIGPGGIVGKSTHSLAQAAAAREEEPDYIGFGPLFATPTKPGYPPIGTTEILAAHELVDVPIFCIGGIKLENLPPVLAAGASRVVIVSGILQAPDISAYIRECRQILNP